MWEHILRVLSLITLFIGAYTLVQGVFVLLRNYGQQDISFMVVILYLLTAPFCFLAALLFAISVHRMVQEKSGEMLVVGGFAMAILATIDDIIYLSVYNEDFGSLILLAGIELVCYIICFLHYQGLELYVLAVCAGFLLAGCAAVKMNDIIQYFKATNHYDFTGYYFAKEALHTLLALISLLFVFALQKNIIYKKTMKKKR